MKRFVVSVLLQILAIQIPSIAFSRYHGLNPLTLHFVAMGDLPYTEEEYKLLKKYIADINADSNVDFVVHLGDIKTGSQACVEAIYSDVARILKTLNKQTFIVPGDNEINDCVDPTEGWRWWNKYFQEFDTNWRSAVSVERQIIRPENFSFVEKGVLIIGIHLVGGSVHDINEWNTRQQQNADWVSRKFNENSGVVRGAVLLAHSVSTGMIDGKTIGKHTLFTNLFRKAARTFKKPILYLHGDGHLWIQDRPWPEKNILRVQVTQGGLAPPLKVSVKRAKGIQMFEFEK